MALQLILCVFLLHLVVNSAENTSSICQSNPCVNEGHCFDLLYDPQTKFVCICPDCYTGDLCQTRLWCNQDYWSALRFNFSSPKQQMIGSLSVDVFCMLISLAIMVVLIGFGILVVYLGVKFQAKVSPCVKTAYPLQPMEPTRSEENTQSSTEKEAAEPDE